VCGIAGILIKDSTRPGIEMTTGEALTRMLEALEHRGPDSAGFALYEKPLDGAYRLRFLISDGTEKASDVDRIREALAGHGAEIVDEETIGGTYRAVVRYTGDIKEFLFAMEHASRVISFGTSLDIVKDVGTPRDLAARYRIPGFNGTHAIGHTRLATESGVHPETSHPFWATGFADVAVVHNGQITNYWIMRRRLERQGMEFHTINDTELIAVYLAFKMRRGSSLEEALRSSLDELDGNNCYISWDVLLSTDKGLDHVSDVFIFVQDDSELEISEMVQPRKPVSREASSSVQVARRAEDDHSTTLRVPGSAVFRSRGP